MARAATRYYPSIRADELRWVLAEASDRILPEVRESLGRYTVNTCEPEGVAIHLATRVTSVHNGLIELDIGIRFDSDTVIWNQRPQLPAQGPPRPRHRR